MIPKSHPRNSLKQSMTAIFNPHLVYVEAKSYNSLPISLRLTNHKPDLRLRY